MPDDEEQRTTEIRTAADLKIEELTKRLDDLEASNKELREANAGLWAAAHPVPQTPETVTPTLPETDAADYVLKELGVE